MLNSRISIFCWSSWRIKFLLSTPPPASNACRSCWFSTFIDSICCVIIATSDWFSSKSRLYCIASSFNVFSRNRAPSNCSLSALVAIACACVNSTRRAFNASICAAVDSLSLSAINNLAWSAPISWVCPSSRALISSFNCMAAAVTLSNLGRASFNFVWRRITSFSLTPNCVEAIAKSTFSCWTWAVKSLTFAADSARSRFHSTISATKCLFSLTVVACEARKIARDASTALTSIWCPCNCFSNLSRSTFCISLDSASSRLNWAFCSL